MRAPREAFFKCETAAAKQIHNDCMQRKLAKGAPKKCPFHGNQCPSCGKTCPFYGLSTVCQLEFQQSAAQQFNQHGLTRHACPSEPRPILSLSGPWLPYYMIVWFVHGLFMSSATVNLQQHLSCSKWVEEDKESKQPNKQANKHLLKQTQTNKHTSQERK